MFGKVGKSGEGASSGSNRVEAKLQKMKLQIMKIARLLLLT